MTRRPFAIGIAMLLALVGCRDDSESPMEPPVAAPAGVAGVSLLSFRQVSAGYDVTCGVTLDDQAYCWGDARYGQLGNGMSTGPETCHVDHLAIACSTRPVPVAGGLAFRQVSTGSSHSCGVTPDNLAYCWGENGAGQLGAGPLTNTCGGVYCSTRPVAVAGGFRFRAVSAGWGFTCGITYPDSRAYCWGDGSYGRLGNGLASSAKPVPVAGDRRWRQVSAGLYHACGVTADYHAFCWGFNRFGQVGDSTTSEVRMRPRLVAIGRRFLQVAAGARHSCGVTITKKAFCWGDGIDGQLGNGGTSPSSWPRRVAGGLSFERVTTGTGHTCGETSGNKAYCWGFNGWGALGDGLAEDISTTPVPVSGGLAFKQLTVGHTETCGRTADAVAYCWGGNLMGNLGDGTTDGHSTPAAVAGAM